MSAAPRGRSRNCPGVPEGTLTAPTPGYRDGSQHPNLRYGIDAMRLHVIAADVLVRRGEDRDDSK